MGKVLYSLNKHTVKAVHVEAVSNGQLVVHLHCCDNPSTEHRHTIDKVHNMTREQIDVSLAEATKFVAEQHASFEASLKHLKALVEEGGVSVVGGTSMRHLD